MIDYSIAVRSAQPGTKKEDVTVTKAYGVAQISEIMTLPDFAKHISTHGCVYGRADVQAILIMMVDCMREQLLEGKKIQLGDLGAFGISLTSEGAETAEKFTANNIKAVNVIWDRGPLFMNLREDAEFRVVASRKAQADAVDEMRGGGSSDGEGEDDGDLS